MTNYNEFEKGFSGLFDTKLVDLLPDDSVDTRCLSYAVKMALQQLQKYSESIVIHYNVENMPEELLDYLAAEKSLPFYDGTYDIALKRRLVQDGLSWYFKAGTKEGVESLIQTIFGSGTIKEWFEFDDEEQVKGTFDVNIRGEHITPDAVESFNKVLKNAKNVSRHLRNVSEDHDILLQTKVHSSLVIPDKIIIQ